MILNETSVKYHIPLIDLGTGIVTEKGYMEAGGQVRIVLPDGYCLACIDGINYAKAGEELLNEQDRQMRRAAGYVQGHDIPSPSVISLNGTIASLAVTEFLNLITGIREVNTYITYDMQSNNVIAQTLQAERDESCPVCGRNGIKAMGDLIPFPNLLEQRIPEQHTGNPNEPAQDNRVKERRRRMARTRTKIRIREKAEEPPHSANPGRPLQKKANPATDPAYIRTHIHL